PAVGLQVQEGIADRDRHLVAQRRRGLGVAVDQDVHAAKACTSDARMTATLGADRPSGMSAPQPGGCRLRRLVGLAGAEHAADRCWPTQRAFFPTTPTCSSTPRWPARSACTSTTSCG